MKYEDEDKMFAAAKVTDHRIIEWLGLEETLGII